VEWGDASGVSRGDDGYFQTEGLGIMGASLGKDTGSKAGIDEPGLVFTSLVDQWWYGHQVRMDRWDTSTSLGGFGKKGTRGTCW
jgi:hypothetical protein